MQCALIDLCFKGEAAGALNVLGGGRLLYWVAFTRTSCLIRVSQPLSGSRPSGNGAEEYSLPSAGMVE